ncbi:DUF4097 domain-containing protein [Paenibacillus tarimensis]
MKKMLGLLFITAGVIGLLAAVNGKSLFSFVTEPFHAEETVDAAEVNNIEIDVARTNVKVVKGSSSDIRVALTGSVSPRLANDIRLDVSLRGDTLEIGVDRENGFSFGFSIVNVDLIVELPSKSWNGFTVDTGSGNINIEEVAASDIRIDGGSGNMNAERLTAERLEFELGSGNVKLLDSTADIIGKVSSGNIRIDGTALNKIDVQTGSGNIRIAADRLTGDVGVKTGSGNVNVDLSERPESLAVKARTGSGDINVRWDNFTQTGSKGSTFEGAFGDGDIKLDVRTGSGNFTLGER